MADPLLRIKLYGGPELVEKLRAKPSRFLEVLLSKMSALAFQLQSKIVSEKLFGQVLHRRSGMLAGSIRAVAAHIEGKTIVSSVQGAGSTSFHGKFHEYGTQGRAWEIIHGPKTRALHFVVDGKDRFAASVVHPPLPERSFLRSALAEFRQVQISLDFIAGGRSIVLFR